MILVASFGILLVLCFGFASELAERNRSTELEEYTNNLVSQLGFWEEIEGARYFPSDPSGFVNQCVEIQEGIFLVDKNFVYRARDFDRDRFANDPSRNDDFVIIDLQAKRNGKFLGVTPGLAVYEIEGNCKVTELARNANRVSRTQSKNPKRL